MRKQFRVQKHSVIYGPTRFASDFEALINKFIAFIYPACDPGVFIPAALMQLANYFNFIILAASKEPMTSSVLK